MCAFFVGDEMEKYMNEALKEANKALKKGEVPIGCVIVKDDKIISRGYNKKESSNFATAHAEIIAINKACKKLNNWRLSDCTLYVTVEPCLMCCGAIIQSRIKKVVYGTPNEYYGAVESLGNTLNNYDIEVKKGILQNKCSCIIQEFFKKRR